MDELGTIFLDSDTVSAALGDLAIAPDGRLLLATVDGSSLLALDGGGIPRLTGRLDLKGGGLTAGRDLTLLPGAEGTVLALLPGGGAPTLATLRADGRLSATPGDAGAGVTAFERSLLLDTAGGPLLLATEWRSGALSSFRPGEEGGLQPLASVTDAAPGGLSEATALAGLRLGGRDFALLAEAGGNTISSYRVGTDGGLSRADALGPEAAVGFQGLTALAATAYAGTGWVLAGAQGSGSISVLRIDGAGRLTPVTHALDTLDTRFGGLSELSLVEARGHVFVLAAGADDGFSLLRLLPTGRLLHVASVADTAGTALAGVSGLTGRATGSGAAAAIEIAAAGAGDLGVSLFRHETGDLAPLIRGNGTAARLEGDGRPDLIMAGSAGDTLVGGGGDDVLIDGAGADRMAGGAGADVFVLAADGKTDRILDFDPTQDRLDLGAMGRLHGPSALDIQGRPDGAVIRFAGEDLVIRSADGGKLTADSLAPALRFELSQAGYVAPDPYVPPAPVPDPPPLRHVHPVSEPGGQPGGALIKGTAAAQVLQGGTGDDTLRGMGGGDRLEGGAGHDTADYGWAGAGMVLDLEGPWRNTGAAAGDRYAGIENLTGSPHADSMRGDARDNVLTGGGGNDWLVGREGDDTLVGEGGNDVFWGGAGADVMIGGSGTDRADYRDTTEAITADLAKPWRNTGVAEGDSYDSIEYIFGSLQADSLAGDAGRNRIWTDLGDDWLVGRDGDDHLEGGAGDDILMGGAGADLLVGGFGFDRADYREAAGAVVIDMLNYGAATGEAAGDVFYGIEALYGTGYDDVLSGNNAPNTLWGHGGNDRLEGRRATDTLVGQAGDDTLDGGLADDVLTGGAGRDVFVFTQGRDVITDFQPGADAIRLDDALWHGAPLDAGAVVARFGTVTDAGVVLEFDRWSALEIDGANDLQTVIDAIEIF